MEHDKNGMIDQGNRSSRIFDGIEITINTINHALIAITTFYITWYAFTVGFVEYQTYHAWFTTIGFQLFMSEGIMILYSNNSYSLSFKSRKSKVTIHWILMTIGGGFSLFGIPYQIYQRQIMQRAHLHNTHGIVGFISGIFLILAILSGSSALFSTELKRFIKPFFSKLAHKILSTIAYVLGMIGVISAYVTRSWLVKSDPGNVRYIMVYLLSFITLFTLIGPIKSTLNQFRK